jgi:hypothetical protein|tara:strand:- start:504 stop:746 length:243 start_codon:yes stop_codon:yes gene_type:complete
MRAQIINIIGPYDGPFDFNLMTYKLRLFNGNIIAWHENGRRGFPKELDMNCQIDGLELSGSRPNYKKSKIIQLYKQESLF